MNIRNTRAESFDFHDDIPLYEDVIRNIDENGHLLEKDSIDLAALCMSTAEHGELSVESVLRINPALVPNYKEAVKRIKDKLHNLIEEKSLRDRIEKRLMIIDYLIIDAETRE